MDITYIVLGFHKMPPIIASEGICLQGRKLDTENRLVSGKRFTIETLTSWVIPPSISRVKVRVFAINSQRKFKEWSRLLAYLQPTYTLG